MHKDAEQLYQHADNFSTVMGFNEQNLPAVDGYIEDNQEIKLGNENIKIIYPGRNNGSICIYHQKNKFVVVRRYSIIVLEEQIYPAVHTIR